MKIAKDKKLHFMVSLCLSIVFINLFNYFGFLIVVFILAWKEIVYDKFLGNGTPEWMDFVAGLIPAIIILLLHQL